MENEGIYLLNAKRTAIGKFLGSFYENDPCEVSSQVIIELLKNINPSDVDMTIVGMLSQPIWGRHSLGR